MKSQDKSIAVAPHGERTVSPRGPGATRWIFIAVFVLALMGVGFLAVVIFDGSVGSATVTESAADPVQDAGVLSFDEKEIEILSSLEKKKEALNNREKMLSEKEKRLDQVGRELAQRLDALEALRGEIATLYEREATEQEFRVQAMAKSLSQNMQAGKAAAILSEMKVETAVRIVPLISSQQLASILEKMDKGKAAALTTLYINQKKLLPKVGD